ncbi:MAG: glycosyltransferase [Desulfobacteraceae bacterium]|nr:glycosyltransferase [Desulfobacteraceae bacterium]
MKLTVIVPVYNGQDTIAACLDALLDQESKVLNEDYSILVVDDGSTDRTPQILGKYPVEVLRLPENQGRIVARLSGAKRAGTGKILFVDSRIRLPADTLAKLDGFEDYRAVIGEVDVEGTKYESYIHTVLYLIRRRYYGKEYFPMQSEEIRITRENFKRAPKGTALLLIDRNLFIGLTPERTGKEVNDDTLLFQKLVFGENLVLLRSRRLLFRYSQRTETGPFTSWLFHRGVRFADFYLRPGGYYFIPFAIAAVLGLALLAATLPSLGMVLFLLLAADACASFYLAENRRDFIRTFCALPPIVTIFGAGVARFWVKRAAEAFRRIADPSSSAK